MVGDYLSITKPAIASLNVFVGVATMLLAVGLYYLNAYSMLLLVAAGFLAAAFFANTFFAMVPSFSGFVYQIHFFQGYAREK
jgi:heme O synthase-like polyprenyltransferase